MATFIAHAHRDFRHPYLLHGEELHGTDASDIFLGSAGTDTIYAGGGSDEPTSTAVTSQHDRISTPKSLHRPTKASTSDRIPPTGTNHSPLPPPIT